MPWAAGGGTDAVARQIAMMLERDLKQPVNVVNRIGGSGVVGHTAIASAAPDGYTIGMITLEINMMHWVGLTTLTSDQFTPFALMNHRRRRDPCEVGLAVQDREGAVRAHQGEPEQGRGVGLAGRAAAGISRSPA